MKHKGKMSNLSKAIREAIESLNAVQDVFKTLKKFDALQRNNEGNKQVPQHAKTRIKTLTNKLKIATHALSIYANSDLWKFRDVVDETHPDMCFTSFECNPLQDGWSIAKKALSNIGGSYASLRVVENKSN